MPVNTIIRHEGERFNTWKIDELYTGPASLPNGGVHVPNVNDHVFSDNAILKVISVDSTTLIPELRVFMSRDNDSDVSKDTFEKNLNRNFHLTRYHVYMNDDEGTAVIDAAIPIFNAELGKLFQGTDVSNNGIVISDTSVPGGQPNDTVTLESSHLPGSTETVKTIPVFKVNRTMPDKSVCTFVAYSTTGEVVFKEAFLVNKTSAVLPANITPDYIHSIELDHWSVSPTEPNTIMRDLGVPFDATGMRCKVTLTSGQVNYVNIDGTHARLVGLKEFNNNLLGPSKEVILIYNLNPTQRAVNTQGTPTNPTLSRVYKVQNYKKEQVFNYRLWALPEWDQGNVQWVINKYRMTSLEYDINQIIPITQIKVTGLDTTLLEDRQEVVLSVEMDDVLPGIHPGHVHVQTFYVSLREPSRFGQDPFIIDYVGGRTKSYGANVDPRFVPTAAQPYIDLTSNETTLEGWLRKFYYEAAPIYDTEVLTKAPEPTHVRIINSNTDKVIPVTEWNTHIERSVADSYIEFDPITFEWMIINGNVTKYLAVTNSVLRRTK